MKAVGAFLLMLCCLAGSQAWRCSEGPQLVGTVQIDAGQGKVVAISRSYAYFLMANRWYRMSTLRFRHVSSGPAGVWAADTGSRVHKFVGSHFRRAGGLSMQQVDAGGDDLVVGSSSNRGYCLRSTWASAFYGAGSLGWTYQAAFKYISCSPKHGCWGVTTRDWIYHTRSLAPTTCRNAGWRRIAGASKTVEVGTDGNVFVVTRAGAVFQRTGVSLGRPQGVGWTRISMCMGIRSVSYDLRTLWAVTNSGWILRCTH
ncbi:fish-egg lectin-like [Symphorus nematophorus]